MKARWSLNEHVQETANTIHDTTDMHKKRKKI